MVTVQFNDERLPPNFWARVRVNDVTGCWEWIGAILGQGYSGFSAEKKQHYAHRFAYEALVGPIPQGLQIDHLCRVILCVNPAHLEPVTLRENIRRQFAAKTHCLQGHPFDEENTRFYKGFRKCKTCMRQAVRNYQKRNKLREQARLEQSGGQP